MTPLRKRKKFPKVKDAFVKGAFFITVTGILVNHTACSSSSSEQEWETVEETVPTQGVITHIKEVEKEKFKITDEQLVDKKEDSRVIASYLDGTSDTLTLDEVKVTEERGRRGMGSTLMMGLMAYHMGKRMGSPINRNGYSNQSSFNKSNTTGRSTMTKTAQKVTSRKPVNARKGFGSSGARKSSSGG